MASAPIGSIVKITYDALVEQDDVLETTTGRLYMVVHVRVQQRGRCARHRRHLTCMVIDALPPGEHTVRPLRWYKR